MFVCNGTVLSLASFVSSLKSAASKFFEKQMLVGNANVRHMYYVQEGPLKNNTKSLGGLTPPSSSSSAGLSLGGVNPPQ